MDNNFYNQPLVDDVMRFAGQAIEHIMKPPFGNVGFALLIFEFNKPGVAHYVSNAEREKMILSLKETVERLEKNQDIPAVLPGVH